MKTIIVATDYSEPARNATHYAAALAQRTGADTLV
ncbi:MAG: universal stress protein, partial [Cytophagales bacterium]|nr:universal stress protein [Cytophagales bacterium]